MNIKNFFLGIYMTNCYLAWTDKSQSYLFDCGGADLEKVRKFAEDNSITLKHIILTHGHYDHIGGIANYKNFFPHATLYIGVEDEVFLKNSEYNLSQLIDGSSFSFSGDYSLVKEGDFIGEFKVIDTPGHTAGSKCFYNAESKILFSGDTLFKRSFGRTDMITGDTAALYNSLNKLCTSLPQETKVYSGHSDVTTIEEETVFLRSIGILK